MTDQNGVPPELLRILRDELQEPALELTAAMTPDDVPGWDSTSMAGIVMALEEELGVEFRAKELKDIRSVGDLARLLSQHRV